MSSKIGIMQGRLSKSVNGKIQSFPIYSWKKEFYLAKEIGFELIEWVLDDDLQNNPILNKKAFPEIESLKNDTGIDIDSICCDYFITNSLSNNSKLAWAIPKDPDFVGNRGSENRDSRF